MSTTFGLYSAHLANPMEIAPDGRNEAAVSIWAAQAGKGRYTSIC